MHICKPKGNLVDYRDILQVWLGFLHECFGGAFLGVVSFGSNLGWWFTC